VLTGTRVARLLQSHLVIDAMFPAAFLALLSPQLRRPGAARAAVTGALIAAALITITPPGIPIVAAIGALIPAARTTRRLRRGLVAS
jgi:predicted branched-subunit amino acid permease